MRLPGRSRKHSQPRIYGFQGFFAKERIERDNNRPRQEIAADALDRALNPSPDLSSLAPANWSEPQSYSWPAPMPELLPAAVEHTSKHTWPAVAWHGTRRHGRSCHRPALATHP